MKRIIRNRATHFKETRHQLISSHRAAYEPNQQHMMTARKATSLKKRSILCKHTKNTEDSDQQKEEETWRW